MRAGVRAEGGMGVGEAVGGTCSDGVHALSSFEQRNEYETQTASASPGGI